MRFSRNDKATRPGTLQARLYAAEAEILRLRAEDTQQMRTPDTATGHLRDAVTNFEQEHFVCLYLNARQQVLKTTVVSVGSVAHVDVHPREVFRDAVRIVAHSIIIGHNHPSGDPEPSEADCELTRRLVKAGKLMGIPVIDHVVFTQTKSVSFVQSGRME